MVQHSSTLSFEVATPAPRAFVGALLVGAYMALGVLFYMSSDASHGMTVTSISSHIAYTFIAKDKTRDNGSPIMSTKIADGTIAADDVTMDLVGFSGVDSSAAGGPIDRIYYINLAKHDDRRAFMEAWLLKQQIQYQRVEGSFGATTGCASWLSDPAQCQGVQGVRDSNLRIIDSKNMSGISLVLEDDVLVATDRIAEAIRDVPPDWDIIRFDCGRAYHTYASVPPAFRRVTATIFETRGRIRAGNESHKLPGFCGGAFAVSHPQKTT